MLSDVIGDLNLIGKQVHLVMGDGHIREEDWVELDIGSSEVEKPSNIIQSRQDKYINMLAFHSCPDFRHLNLDIGKIILKMI
jgi:hypothetical protein